MRRMSTILWNEQKVQNVHLSISLEKGTRFAASKKKKKREKKLFPGCPPGESFLGSIQRPVLLVTWRKPSMDIGKLKPEKISFDVPFCEAGTSTHLCKK